LKVFRLILFSSIALVLFFTSGCNDTPNSVGRGTQSSGDYGEVKVDTFYATDHSTISNLIYTSSIDRFMLGRNKTYQAWACLKFYSWPDSLTGGNVRITNATIRLKGLYHFGDSTASLSFDVLRAISSITNDSLTYDSLTLNSSFYYNNQPIASQSFMPIGDTMAMTLNILDTTMLREWFSTNTDTLHLNDGLILRPTNSNIIKGFYSFASGDTSVTPVLTVTYVDTNGNVYDYVHTVGFCKYVSTVERASIITDNNLMYVQNGISYRGLMSFDSLAKISSIWPVTIFRAKLQVMLDASQYISNDSLYVLSVNSSGQVDGAFYALSDHDTVGGRKAYSFESRSLAIQWLSNTSARKAVLSGYGETTSFDLFKLYGTGIYRPRIIITYAVQR
jgi:hypothetical protein